MHIDIPDRLTDYVENGDNTKSCLSIVFTIRIPEPTIFVVHDRHCYC